MTPLMIPSEEAAKPNVLEVRMFPKGATASFCAADSDINPKAGLQTSITKKNEKNWKRTKQSQNTHA